MAGYFLEIPTKKGLVVAGIAIVIFMVAAFFLYTAAGKTPTDFGLKVADYLLQGALVSLLFAILKAIIDSVRAARRGAPS